MKSIKFNFLSIVCFMLCPLVFMTSCKEDPIYEMSSYQYDFHSGQAVPTAAYVGTHPADFSADMDLEELENGNTMISITLNNTIDGETYHLHAHDAADAATTPNGTPYNESPNEGILVQMVEGNGGSVTVTQEATMGYTALTTTYEGFFVVHDPLQAVSTTDISTYLVVGSFARTQTATDYQSTTFAYELHNGQTVSSAPYAGTHSTDFSVDMQLEKLANGNTRISTTLNNTIEGETYHLHAHDAADPATTPNGTPYNESPNADIFVQMVEGNGGSVTVRQESTMDYTELTTNYEGFFVVHDPLQAVSTTDISTYLVVGSFARTQAETNYQSSTFMYDFNVGQVAEVFGYVGSHEASLSASIQVDELADNASRITVRIMNSMDGQTYHTHAHDMADPLVTINGTPYIETPNMEVFAASIAGNGGTAVATNVSSMSYADITTTYDGFFVVHDPLQAISTIAPTTYVILGVFAR